MPTIFTKYGPLDSEIADQLTAVYIWERLKGKGLRDAHTAVSDAAQRLGIPAGRAWDYASFVQDRVEPPEWRPATREDLERMLRVLQPGASSLAPRLTAVEVDFQGSKYIKYVDERGEVVRVERVY
jgi:hypothetical protein